jgi:hypothetical protein
MGLKGVPGLPDTAWSVRAYHPDHRPEQLIGELVQTTLLGQPGSLGGLDIPADGLTIRPR